MTAYTTIQGDTWDGIAFRLWGREHLMDALLQANPDHADVLVFPAGVNPGRARGGFHHNHHSNNGIAAVDVRIFLGTAGGARRAELGAPSEGAVRLCLPRMDTSEKRKEVMPPWM